MNQYLTLLLTAVTAAFFESCVFARGLGAGIVLRNIENKKDLPLSCAYMALFSLLTALFSWLLWWPVSLLSFSNYLHPLVAVVSASVAFGLISFLLWKIKPNFYRSTKYLLPFSAFNSAVFGCVFLAIRDKMSLLQALFAALGFAIAFALATFFLHEGRRRLSMCKIPKAFQGLPSLLIYIGIIAIAIHGLAGQLPK